jgi:hypothetical protein
MDITPIMTGVLSAAASAFNDCGRTPGRVELTPGNLPAWDDCCEGQLYVRVMELYPTGGQNSPFPQIDASQRGAASALCKIHMMAVHVGVGILRCAATVDDDGTAPTPARVTNDAVLMYEDSATLLNALVCDVPSVKGILSMKLDRWTPLGVEGGCAGGEWGAYFAVDPCLCAGG